MADNRKLRVLQVALGLGTGGAERSTVDLIPHLDDHNVTVTVFCRSPRPGGAEMDLADRAPIIYATDPRFGPWVRELRRTITHTAPDVVHTVLFEADLAGRLASVGTGVPVLTSLVNESYGLVRRTDPGVNRVKLEGARVVEAIGGKALTDHFHALTESVKIAAHEHLFLPLDRISVVPRGREPDRLGKRTAARTRHVRERLGISATEQVLLTVGRQEYQKGQDVLLEAVALLRKTNPNLRLVLAGRPGAWSTRLDQIIATRGLESAVVRTGHVDDVADLYTAADVFILPSRFEGFGGVLLEAMALEAPIVVSDLGPTREVVGGSEVAALVPPGDEVALADAIGNLLGDEDRRLRLAAEGLQRFWEKYEITAVSGAMARLYRSVAERGRRRLMGPSRSRRT